MRFLKFSSLIIFMPFQLFALDTSACLDSRFETLVEHPGPPFGLTKNILNVKKSNCLIDIHHTRFQYLKSHWKIDVCREPVHIKKSSNGIQVLKRKGVCGDKASSDFCSEFKSIQTLLQDDGLIFAEGEKENIQDDHGRIYCAYMLLNKYLGSGSVLSRYKKVEESLIPPPVENIMNQEAPSEEKPSEDSSGDKTGSF